jgi:two-component system, NtrC family, sensor kinase
MSGTEEEIKRRLSELEAENATLRESKDLLSARTTLAWMGMESSAWRHSILSQIAAIRNYVAIIQRLLKTEFNPSDIDLLMKEIDGIAEKISEYPFIPPLAPEDGLEKINISDLIREVIEQFPLINPSYLDIQISYLSKSDEHVLVRANLYWLRRGLDLLFDNSAKAMVSSSIKRLTIRTSLKYDKVYIFIEDTGHGISPDVRPLLFIQPIRKNRSEKGLGVGLLIARMIFQTFGGDLKLEQTDFQGTTFAINLPKAE